MKKPVLALAWLLLVTFILATLGGKFSQFGLVGEICSYFCVQYSIALVIAATLFMWVKQWKGAIAAMLFAVINFSSYIPFSFGSPDASEYVNAHPIKVFYMNVNYGNDQYGYSVNYIKHVQPDLIAVSELTEKWSNVLQHELSDYKYRIIESRPDAFGIALFSRLPLLNGRVEHWGRAQLPSIVADVDQMGKQVSVLATHPLPPLSTTGYDLRNEQLTEIAAHRAEFQKSLIVLADLNATCWSYWFQNLLQKLEVQDTRSGFGVQQTWPDGPIPSIWNLIFVPLDHILASRDWVTIDRRVGPRIGSDHLPVYAELVQSNR